MKRNRLILLALMLIGLLNAQKVCAQTEGETSSVVWKGNTIDEVITTDATNSPKPFYLFNVGSKKFISQGDLWGTCAVMSKTGLQFQGLVSTTNVSGVYNIKTKLDKKNVCYSNGKNLVGENRFYLDQANYNDDTHYKKEASSFIFELVDDGVSDGTSGSKIYTLYATSLATDKDNAVVTDSCAGTIYLSAFNDSICIGKQRTDKNGTTITADADVTDYEKWIIVTYQDIVDNFNNANGTFANPASAPHLLSDAGFYRNDLDIVNWKIGKELKSFVPYTGTETQQFCYAVSTITKSGETITASNSIVDYSGYTYNSYRPLVAPSSADNPNSKILPTLTSVSEDGNTITTVYYIGNGYDMDKASTTTTVTFEDEKSYTGTYYMEPFGGDWAANIHGAEGSIAQTISSAKITKQGWYKVSAKGFSNDGKGYLFAYAQTTGQTTTDKYAYQAFVQLSDVSSLTTYVKAARYVKTLDEQSVIVYVESGESLTFGAYIQNGTADSWTCFDDFSLYYLGDPVNDLIIDEGKTEIDYINGQTYDKNQTLRLVRTFKTGQWNSLILPVNLTAQQVKTAFGADTKLSVLTGSTTETPNRIYFNKVDLTDDNSTVIYAGTQYIIKPQNDVPTDQDVKTRTSNGVEISSGTSYYTINQVAFTDAMALTSSEVRSDPAVSGAVGDGDLTFVGTYVKKGNDVTSGTTAIPANSYILGTKEDPNISKWYYTSVPVKNVKGLRGWLETSGTSTEVKFFINGVEEGEATAIEGVMSDSKVSAVSGNIYNLNGQLVRSNSTSAEGLNKGIYIIGGKKVVVK